MESLLKMFPTLKTDDKIAIGGDKLRILLKRVYMDGESGNTHFVGDPEKYKKLFVEFDKLMDKFGELIDKFFK